MGHLLGNDVMLMTACTAMSISSDPMKIQVGAMTGLGKKGGECNFSVTLINNLLSGIVSPERSYCKEYGGTV